MHGVHFRWETDRSHGCTEAALEEEQNMRETAPFLIVYVPKEEGARSISQASRREHQQNP